MNDDPQSFCGLECDLLETFPPLYIIFESNFEFIELPEIFGPGKMAIFLDFRQFQSYTGSQHGTQIWI